MVEEKQAGGATLRFAITGVLFILLLVLAFWLAYQGVALMTAAAT